VSDAPILEASGLDLRFGAVPALDGVALRVWPGEVVAILGESGSGKTSLLRVLSGALAADAGRGALPRRGRRPRAGAWAGEAALRRLARTEWGFVHQNPRDGLRLGVSAGGNVGERLMAVGRGTTAASAPRRRSGCAGWRSTRRAWTTCRATSPAGCSSACRSRAPW
jgi:putative phosphonate transport system ATP-binding protein